MSPGIVFVVRRKAVICGHVIELAATLENSSVFGLADPRGGLDQGVEHRLQVECRAADDLEQVCSRCLLLKGLAELGGTGLYLFKQSYVLDCNHGLVGERLE